MQRDVATADRRGAGAAVGLQHVAVDGDLHLAHHREVGDRAQRPADEALDLLGAARLLARGRLTVVALRRSSPGASSTRRSPSRVPLPRSHGGTRSSTDAVHSTRVRPNSTSTEPIGELGEVAGERDRAQLVGLAPVTCGFPCRPLWCRRAVAAVGVRSVVIEVRRGQRDRLAERLRAFRGRRLPVDLGPEVREDQALRVALRAPPRRPACAERWIGGRDAGRGGTSPPTARGRHRRRTRRRVQSGPGVGGVDQAPAVGAWPRPRTWAADGRCGENAEVDRRRPWRRRRRRPRASRRCRPSRRPATAGTSRGLRARTPAGSRCPSP